MSRQRENRIDKQATYRKVFSRLRKCIKDLEDLAEEGECVDTIIGDLKRVQDGLHVENFKRYHRGVIVIQTELFAL